MEKNKVLTLAALAGILISILFLSSCQDDDPTNCPIYEIGAIEGRLVSSGLGLSAEIAARSLDGPNSNQVVRSTVSDSTGWYQLELPTGLYRLEVKALDGHHTSFHDSPDTVRVQPKVHHHDLARGRAEIRITVPEELEDQSTTLRITHENRDSFYRRGTVHNGLLLFEFPVLSPGAHDLKITFNSLAQQFYLPGTMDINEAQHLDITCDQVATYDVDFNDSYATISGTVTGSWLQAWHGSMSMTAFKADSVVTSKVRCEQDGSFSCGFFFPQSIRLFSSFDGIGQWEGGDCFSSAQVFDLHGGEHITGVQMVESGIQVLLSGPGNLTTYNQTIQVRDEFDNLYTLEFGNSNPTFICNLSPGRYFVQARGFCENERWAAQWFDGTETQVEATPVDLAQGELRQIEIKLVEGGSISGQVLMPDESVPFQVQCSIFDDKGQHLCTDWNQWQWFYNGIFRFAGLPDGDFYLGVELSTDNIWWYPGTRNWNEATTLVIQDHSPLEAITWLLPQTGRKVQP